MDKEAIIKISVRNLIEYVMRSGDLISSFKGVSRNMDAIKIHNKLQKKGGKEYNKEYYLCFTTEIQGTKIQISGRADGVIIKENEIIIDEIKTTTQPLSDISKDMNPMHFAQAKVYAYIYAKDNNLDSIKVQLTYYSFLERETKVFLEEYKILELETFFYDLIGTYMKYAKLIKSWREERNKSIELIKFPFASYRKGQREFAVAVYKTMKLGKTLFVEAPTGIGKTMASLFPVIKGMGEEIISKMFYLTAKTINRIAVEKAINNMMISGLKLKTVNITAKEKICFEDKNCDPMVCSFAKGHYSRVNEALNEIFKNEDFFTKEIIEKYAKKYHVCPFEFSLDLCDFADLIVCDYNYVFDPRVHLRRFFDSYEDYALLIDEAHNLPDRAREMYSSELNKKSILKLRKNVKNKIPELYKNLGKINSYFIKMKKSMEGEYLVAKVSPKDLYELLRKFLVIADIWLSKDEEDVIKEELLENYFSILGFCKTFELYSEKYITYFLKSKDDLIIKLFCQDPSDFIESTLKNVKASIFFSATLTPMDYFIDILCKSKDCYKIKLKSPFKEENMCLIIDDKVSTKYKDRKYTYDYVVEDIWQLVKGRKGNYIIFSPSYTYMETIYSKFKDLHGEEDYIIIKQQCNMDEKMKEEFLDSFKCNENKGLIAFSVIGGMFGEGIDLTGDRLIGVVVIGVGMPQICLERNFIKDYYDSIENKGFLYSYVYPGMNKVMQAAGRVIRTNEDRGIVMLIDSRYNNYTYKNLMPTHWNPILKSRDSKNLEDNIRSFWKVKK
ncbi:ATP-dependent DNA helicase [Haloimpatiens sp. FM7315]|uniref:ATP-dependent DNA helicase n=1 Tax=Haloimpatiens sp. FM7315 TaxID=3298609 RepID=UPI003977C316